MRFPVLCFLVLLVWALSLGPAWGQAQGTKEASKASPSGPHLVLRIGAISTDWLQARVRARVGTAFVHQSLHLSTLAVDLTQLKIRLDKKWVQLDPVHIPGRGRLDPDSWSLQEIRILWGSSLLAQAEIEGTQDQVQGTLSLKPQQLLARFASVLSPKLILPPLSASFKTGPNRRRIDCDLQAQGPVRWRSWQGSDLQVHTRLDLSSSGPTFTNTRVSFSGFHQGQRQGPAGVVSMKTLDLGQEVRVNGGKLEMQGLAPAFFAGQWSKQGLDARIQAQGWDLSLLHDWASSLGLSRARNWAVQGKADVQVNLGINNARPQVQMQVDVHQGGTSSPQGEIMAASVGANLQGSLLLEDEPKVDLKLWMGKGEFLWGTAYTSIADTPLQAQVQARLQPGKRVTLSRLSCTWGPMLQSRMRAEVDLSAKERAWAVTVEHARVGLHDVLARIQGILPQGWTVGGILGWQGRVTDSGQGPLCQGRLQWEDVHLNIPQLKVQGMRGFLPMRYRLGQGSGGEHSGPEMPWGRMYPGEILYAEQEVQVKPVMLRLEENRLQVKDALFVQILGAKARFSELSLDLPWEEAWSAKGGFTLSGLHFSRLVPQATSDLGHAQADLSWSASAKAITTKGALQGELFGGAMRIEDISIKRPLEASRLISADLGIKALDLEAVSQFLGIGRITGKMHIDVQNAGVAYAQPVRFHLRAQSTPQERTTRSISLQAVNSLSIIGTGQGLSGLGIRLYAGFFEEFPYDSIGMSCMLANDVFAVSGLIHDNGTEYIVKRKLVGINVVNNNPNNMIAFSDMMERLERIQTQTE